MFKFIKIYSIDIALGAVVNTWFLAQVVIISLPWYIYVIIGIAVWNIYAVDHVLDAYKLQVKDGPSKYHYHKKYLWQTLIVTGISFATALFLVIQYLPEELIKIGMILSGITVLYFLFRLFLKILFSGLKELMAAVIYTSGVAIPAYFYLEEFNFFLALVTLQLFCLVFANLLICALWDEKWDRANAYDSMAILFGRRFINAILLSLIAISFISAASGFFIYTGFYIKVQFVILLMSLGLILNYYYAENLEENVQRFLIDSIFFIPLLLLIL